MKLSDKEKKLRSCFLKQRLTMPLNLKIEMSKRRITEFYNHFDGKIYVSFSGGKDSTVLLHLVRSMFPDVEAVFVDTGLEYPEIKKFVKTVPNVTIIRPEMTFNKVLEKYGYPIISKEVADVVEQSRICLEKNNGTYTYRLKRLLGIAKDKFGNLSIFNCSKWKFLLNAPFKISNKCCDVMKKRPLHKFEKTSGKKALIGTMAVESRLRKQQYIRYGCNAINCKNPFSMPLGFWTEQDILAYLKKYNVPYCSLHGVIEKDNNKYLLSGCERTGCMFYMFGVHLDKSPNRFERMKKTHPKLYNYCIKKLGCGEVLDFINVKY